MHSPRPDFKDSMERNLFLAESLLVPVNTLCGHGPVSARGWGRFTPCSLVFSLLEAVLRRFASAFFEGECGGKTNNDYPTHILNGLAPERARTP
jgi:hypothetical protein